MVGERGQKFGFPKRIKYALAFLGEILNNVGMMYAEKIKAIVANSDTILEALQKVVLEFGEGRLNHLAWGFSVHIHGIARNDSLFKLTCDSPSIVEAFLAVGGTSTDVVATKLPTITQPFQIDVVQLAQSQRSANDPRLKFTETLLANDLNMAWICPIDQPWVGGTGVFNQFYKDRLAEPVFPVDAISEIAHIFHEEIKRRRLIAKEIDLRPNHVEFLSEVAKGKSAVDLAAEYEISSRAAEKRLENIRKALRSRNTLEAVYKATIYGVLPYSNNQI